MFRKFWKEGLLALIIVVLLGVAVGLIPDAAVMPEGTMELSPLVMGLGIFALLIPLFAAMPSGFLIAGKTRALRPVMLVPAAAGVVAAIIVMGAAAAQVVLLPDDLMKEGLITANEYSGGMLGNIGVEEFRALSVNASLFGMAYLAINNFAYCLVGGLAGRAIRRGRI